MTVAAVRSCSPFVMRTAHSRGVLSTRPQQTEMIPFSHDHRWTYQWRGSHSATKKTHTVICPHANSIEMSFAWIQVAIQGWGNGSLLYNDNHFNDFIVSFSVTFLFACAVLLACRQEAEEFGRCARRTQRTSYRSKCNTQWRSRGM